MKYIKYFESISEPEIGDYVLCDIWIDKRDPKEIEQKKFIDNNIGEYIKFNEDLRFCCYISYNQTIPEIITPQLIKDSDFPNKNIFGVEKKRNYILVKK
jgi:hypothetical protein